MANVQEIIDYYVNLLIIQYNNKPKARATIEAFMTALLADGILFDIRDGYSVDTAVGIQLDVIGKYVGVNRFFEIQDLINFFGLTFYTDVSPDTQEKFGFTDYADFEDFQYNGTLNYQSVLNQVNALSDDDFRILIRLKILQNNINHSHKAIDDSIYSIFGTTIIPDSTGGMQMYYFVPTFYSAVIKAALTKMLLPRPMGVRLELIDTTAGVPFYGYATYAHLTPGAITTGFTNYSTYATKIGQTLIYENIES